MSVVADSSVVVETLVGVPNQEKAVERLIGAVAPDLMWAEVGGVIRRFVVAGRISLGRAVESLDELLGLDIESVPSQALLVEAMGMADNVSFSDALYVVTARRLGLPLLTTDLRLSRAVRHHQWVALAD